MDEPAGRTKVLAQIAVCRDAIDAIDAQLVALLTAGPRTSSRSAG